MNQPTVEQWSAEDLLRESFRPRDSIAEAKLVAEMCRGMEQRFAALRAGSRFVDPNLTTELKPNGHTQFELVQGMFPNGASGRPLATDIFSVTVRDFPEIFLHHLSTVVARWREIDSLAGFESYFPDPPSYHVSIAVPQDLARAGTDPTWPHLLQDPEQRLGSDELEDVCAALVGLVHRRAAFQLKPFGARVGNDGALIFVFEFCPELVAIRKEIIGWTKLMTGGRYTGRAKPMASITLARARVDSLITTECEPLLRRFAADFMPAAAPAKPTEGLAPFDVTHVHLAHETHWMFAETDFSERIPLGVSGEAIARLRRIVGSPSNGR